MFLTPSGSRHPPLLCSRKLTEPTREAIAAWIGRARLRSEDFLFPSRVHTSPHLSTRQYARIVESWVREIGLDAAAYGTHTMRRTKASLIYRRTKNLRAVQLLLGHTKLESTVRYLGIEVDDALRWRNRRRCKQAAGTAAAVGSLSARSGCAAKSL